MEKEGHVLIVFFSHAGENNGVGNLKVGNTKLVADEIQKVTGQRFRISERRGSRTYQMQRLVWSVRSKIHLCKRFQTSHSYTYYYILWRQHSRLSEPGLGVGPLASKSGYGKDVRRLYQPSWRQSTARGIAEDRYQRKQPLPLCREKQCGSCRPAAEVDS